MPALVPAWVSRIDLALTLRRLDVDAPTALRVLDRGRELSWFWWLTLGDVLHDALLNGESAGRGKILLRWRAVLRVFPRARVKCGDDERTWRSERRAWDRFVRKLRDLDLEAERPSESLRFALRASATEPVFVLDRAATQALVKAAGRVREAYKKRRRQRNHRARVRRYLAGRVCGTANQGG